MKALVQSAFRREHRSETVRLGTAFEADTAGQVTPKKGSRQPTADPYGSLRKALRTNHSTEAAGTVTCVRGTQVP